MPSKQTRRAPKSGKPKRRIQGGKNVNEFPVKGNGVAGDSRHPGAPLPNPNSKAKADRGEPYERIPRPRNPLDAIDAIDVWARYLHNWGVRVDHEFHGLYIRLQAAGTPTAHLDPPPEPFK